MVWCWASLFGGSLLAFGAGCFLLGDAPAGVWHWMGIVLVMASMAALGAVDGATYRIDPWWLAVLVGAGTFWWVMGSGWRSAMQCARRGWEPWGALLSARFRSLWRRRWVGAGLFIPATRSCSRLLDGVLGVEVLPWALVVGAVCGLGYGGWVLRRRGRRLTRGYLPLGPGMATGAIAAFLGVNLPSGSG